MNSKDRARIEYEDQFFGFSSNVLLESYKDMLKRAICDEAVKSVVEMLKKKLMPFAENPTALEKDFDEMTETLKCNYGRGVDFAVEKLEAKLKECFEIPSNMLLPEDSAVHDVQDVNEENLDKEIADLKQELKNLVILSKQLVDERELVDKTITILQEANDIKPEEIPNI